MVEAETKEIQEKIIEKLANKPIENDVIVLYDGENLPDQVYKNVFIFIRLDVSL